MDLILTAKGPRTKLKTQIEAFVKKAFLQKAEPRQEAEKFMYKQLLSKD